MITHILQIFAPYSEYSYLIIFAVLLACGFGAPIPEDITLVVGGIAAYYKITNFWFTVLICMFGVMIGDSIIFFLGKYLGTKILKSKFLSRIVNVKHIAMVRLKSAKYGNYLVFFARFMPGVRTPVFFSMGMFKKKFYKFFLVDGFAALISVPVWVYAGYFFGENIPVLEHHIKQMEEGMYIIIAALIVIIFLIHYIKKKVMGYLFKRR